MQSWAEDLLMALEGADTEQAVFHTVERAAHQLGFEHCAYGLRAPLPVTNPRVVMLNNYPTAWQQRYSDAGYLAIDPTVRHCRHSQEPILWRDEVFSEVPSFWADARSTGLCVGWAQSSLDRQGLGGMLTLSRSCEVISDAELKAQQMKMRWLTNLAHVSLTRVLMPAINKDTYTPLTMRETEILKWSADGKTSSEIAEIMTISVNTVNFHMKNAVIKLNSANKTAAVVRAAVLGLLS